MKEIKTSKIKTKLLPYIFFPVIVGIISGALIFLFKVTSGAVMSYSSKIYGFVRENPTYLPLLILGAAVLGTVAAIILKSAKECRGGGIPTAVASIKGLIPLKWIQGSLFLFCSALLTFLCGVPLGNEGPSVQMGAATGKFSSRFSKKNRLAWERYLMTGGACSGFAIATSAPIAGIVFALEEAHRRFSTTIFAVASIAVLTGSITHSLLSSLFDIDTTFFNITASEILPMKYFWAAIIIGAVCGVASLLLTSAYRASKKLSNGKAKRIPHSAKIIIIFAFTAVLGFFSANFIGTGHSIIDEIIEGKAVWYALLLAFFARAVLMIFANSEGVSGGLFIPTLAFGAMIASLLTDAFVALGIIDGIYYVILVVVGMASFLSASMRTPITAIIFAAEAFAVTGNILPIIIGVIISYAVAEISGKISFTDTVIESRVEAAHRGKKPIIVYSHMTVQKGAFADGMETKDILWPPTCAVLSIDRNLSKFEHHSVQEIRAGDDLHLHYQTYDPDETLRALSAILGEQPENQRFRSHLGTDEHLVPNE